MANAKKGINIPSIINNYPQSASVISKLTKSENKVKYNPAEINFKDISTSIKDKISTNDDVLDLFPDIELAVQILVSSVLAPNDMVNINLLYEPPTLVLPTNVKQQILDTISSYMDAEYGIREKLPTILRESLFTKGAYIECVIPEASLDDAINQVVSSNITLESYLNKSGNTLGYLGNKSTNIVISTESIDNKPSLTLSKTDKPGKNAVEITQEDLGLQIIDNPNVLLYHKRLLEHKQSVSKLKANKGFNFSTESTDEDLDKMFKSDSTLVFKEYIEIQNKEGASRESIGAPLVMKLPVEAVIPVHVTSDPSKHLGYFIILDENGNPVNIRDDMYNYQEAMNNMTFFNNNNSTNLIQKAKLALHGLSREVPVLKELEPMYNDIVENMIKNKLKNGLYGELADIKYNADVFKVMFARSLRAQQTKVLFLPAELVAYYAFDYRDNGTGKSLIEKNTLLYSVRAMLLFARLMASIKNSINTTVVSATLDEDDPDPESTREKIISESLKTRQASLPLGLIRPDDLVEWTHKVGFMYKIQHPGLPNIELDVTDQAPSKIMPDDELDNKLAERILMSYGLTPEIVMAGYSSDFATTVASRNLLFAKRCINTQMQFMPQVTDHIRKIARNDVNLINKLKEIIKKNIGDIKKLVTKSDAEESDINLKKASEAKIIDYLLDQYINYTEVKLPDIVFTDAAALKNTFEEFKTNMESVADAIFTSTVFNEKFAGKLSEEIEPAKDIWKAMAITRWITENNFMPELTDMFVKDDEGNPEFDIYGQYLNYKDTIVELMAKFAKEAGKSKTKSDKSLTKALDGLGGSEGGDEYGSSDDSGGEGSDMGGSDGSSEGVPSDDGMDNSDVGGGGSDDLGGMDMGDNGDNPESEESTPEDVNEESMDTGSEDTGEDLGGGEPDTGEGTGEEDLETQDTGEEPTEEETTSEEENPEGGENTEEVEEEQEDLLPESDFEDDEEYQSMTPEQKIKYRRQKTEERNKELEEENKQEEQDNEEEEKKKKEEKDKQAEEAYNLDMARSRSV